MKRIPKATLFIILVLSISYAVAGGFYLLFGQPSKTAGIILAVSYMFIPTLTVLIVDKWIHKEPGFAKRNLISFKINKWFLVAWLITPVISLSAFGISLFFPDVIYSPNMEGLFALFEDQLSPEQMEEMRKSLETLPVHPVWITLIQGLIAGLTINAVAGFGEELGWRGFLVRQFGHMHFMKAAVIIGAIWGIWHAPLILMGHNYPQHPAAGVFMMTAWCTLLSPLFLYVTLKAKSVIAAAIMHGTLNGTAGLAIMLVSGGNDLINGMTGVSGFIALIIFTTGLWIYDQFITKENVLSDVLGRHLEALPSIDVPDYGDDNSRAVSM